MKQQCADKRLGQLQSQHKEALREKDAIEREMRETKEIVSKLEQKLIAVAQEKKRVCDQLDKHIEESHKLQLDRETATAAELQTKRQLENARLQHQEEMKTAESYCKELIEREAARYQNNVQELQQKLSLASVARDDYANRLEAADRQLRAAESELARNADELRGITQSQETLLRELEADKIQAERDRDEAGEELRSQKRHLDDHRCRSKEDNQRQQEEIKRLTASIDMEKHALAAFRDSTKELESVVASRDDCISELKRKHAEVHDMKQKQMESCRARERERMLHLEARLAQSTKECHLKEQQLTLAVQDAETMRQRMLQDHEAGVLVHEKRHMKLQSANRCLRDKMTDFVKNLQVPAAATPQQRPPWFGFPPE
eukprot:GHVS01065290.1.p1 GENE.GHVS01065290.1~~GHVS01065290.1.p1  ORF type:complete len:375 (-),score=66.04 GHVS01065290.1:92-1216(-)